MLHWINKVIPCWFIHPFETASKRNVPSKFIYSGLFVCLIICKLTFIISVVLLPDVPCGTKVGWQYALNWCSEQQVQKLSCPFAWRAKGSLFLIISSIVLCCQWWDQLIQAKMLFSKIGSQNLATASQDHCQYKTKCKKTNFFHAYSQWIQSCCIQNYAVVFLASLNLLLVMLPFSLSTTANTLLVCMLATLHP